MHMKSPPGTVRPSTLIIMSYKQQCKAENVVLAKIKIIRAVTGGMSQKDVAAHWKCNKNTVGAIMRRHAELPDELKSCIASKSLTTLDIEHCSPLAHASRAPHGNKRSLSSEEDKTILAVHEKITFGPLRMRTHLSRAGTDMSVYTFAKIKGCYKRHGLIGKKVRTANKERRQLYDYSQIAAFEHLQMDTKKIPDKHALPLDIYEKFKTNPELPIYQWTIIDAKTRTRFLAYSHELSSFFGQRFLLFVVLWLRSHGVFIAIHAQFDGGAEFCSASERKLFDWNIFFSPYGVVVDHTRGDKTKQNLIERSHRPDDEEFYCPRGEFINSKMDFLLEAQKWNLYWNLERSHSGIGMDDMTPVEKLSSLGYANAEAIGRFPTFILEDVHQELAALPVFMKKWEKLSTGRSQNVLDYYRVANDHH